MFNRFDNYPKNHVTITPDDSADLSHPMIIYCGSDGNIVITDKNGTDVTYAVTAGDIIPVLAVRVKDTSTTVTQVIGLY